MENRASRTCTGAGHHALRRGRHSDPGRIYLVTTVTRGRRPWFADFERGARAAACLADRRLWRDGRLLAWVLMPDHWHGLLELGTYDSLVTAVARAKSCAARTLRSTLPPHARLWGPAFHDHALRRDEHCVKAARYIVANPVRAGLVARVGLYPFWDACWLDHDGADAHTTE
jgi:REP element-mobilizing transposase RayT